METTRCISAKVSIGRPLIETTTSPDWKPAAAAALSGLNGIHARAGRGLAVKAENAGEDQDRQDEIRDRPGGHDRRAPPTDL